MLDTSKLKTQLSDLYHRYVDSYQRALNDSFSKKIREIKPGEVTPKPALFYDEDRDTFADVCMKYREEGITLIDNALAEIRAKKTDAPDSDAVNFLTVFRTKTKISEDDIMDALDRYGSNYTMYNALRDLAVEHNIYSVSHHPLDEIEEGLNAIRSSISKMSVADCNDGHAREGYASMFDLSLDMNIPDAIV